MLQNSVERLKEEIRLSKSTTSTLQSELGERDEHLQLLHKEYQRFTDNSNSTSSRSSYTKRILEILSNIKKQRVEIDKIIKDTRILQKDINQLSGRLDRAFTETDELMFQDAKKDVFVRKAYKYVASFHEACAGLIATVEATGVIMRETKDLEDEVWTREGAVDSSPRALVKIGLCDGPPSIASSNCTEGGGGHIWRQFCQ